MSQAGANGKTKTNPGTVTSITFNGGLTSIPDPITSTGTATLDQTALTTNDGTVYWNSGTQRLSTTATGTSGQILTSNGAGVAPSYQAAPASSISITGNSGGALVGNAFTFTGGTTGLLFSGAGTTETLTGTLAIANGGTNATSMANTDGVVYYDGTRLVTTTVGTATYVLTSNGPGLAPTFQAAGGGGGGISTLAGNSGTATGSTVTIETLNATPKFVASAAKVDLDFAIANNILGSTLPAITSGTGNIGMGQNMLVNTTTGGNNIVFGNGTMQFNVSGSNNVALGVQALNAANTASRNFALGTGSLNSLMDGQWNIAIGTSTGNALMTNESSNIYFNSVGVTGEGNTLRIGASTGGSDQQLSRAFIAGINGNTLGSPLMVTIDGSDQLGTAAIPAGGGDVVGPGSSTDRAIVTWNGTGGTNVFDNPTTNIDSSGRQTNTAQPAFFAYVIASQPFVTGDGTVYTLLYDATLFDQNSNMNAATGTFTAPVTGIYSFNCFVYLSGIDSGMLNGNLQLVTTSDTYSIWDLNTFNISNALGSFQIGTTLLVKMSVGDTAIIQVAVGGSGPFVNIEGGINPYNTYFSGHLVC